MTRARLSDAERAHPAKFSAGIIDSLTVLMAEWLPAPSAILDPFAGVGWVHKLNRGEDQIVGVEIEPEWAAANPGVIAGDATRLPFPGRTFDAVVTSPVYPNRMTDSHMANDPCRACKGTGSCREQGLEPIPCPDCGGLGLTKRNTYTHRMRVLRGDRSSKLHENNAGAMRGRAYWNLQEAALREMVRVTTCGGFLFVNVSNHMATKGKGEAKHDVEVDVVGRWCNLLSLHSCLIRQVEPVSTRRNRQGANHDKRADHEVIIVANTPPAGPTGLF